MDLVAQTSKDYEYLDAGGEARLERFGGVVLARPSPAALWRREAPELWDRADAVYERTGEKGQWLWRGRVIISARVELGGLTFEIRPTGFGHVGLFPEHSCHWDWVAERVKAVGASCRVLHLFAYTGALTLAAARAGANVCHVDAVKDVNDWARANAQASGLADAPIRWIADDVMRFVARERRRGSRYDGIILDPPSYGRGPKGEKWILERDLTELLTSLMELMSDAPAFVLFTCHNPGFSPPLTANMLAGWPARFGGAIEAGTMVLRHPERRCVLPCGFYARWCGGGGR